MANTKVTGDLIASSTIATGNIADNAVTSDKISGITTAHITEGSNLYYTNARARGAVSVSGNALAYNSSTGVITSNFEESPVFTGIITANSSSSGDYVRLYGSSGTGKWDIYGNGANLRISDNESAGILVVDTGATFGGNVGIGTSSPERKLHVFKGESGGALSNSDSSLVLENNSHTYIQFLTPTTVESGILFGDTDNDVGAFTYNHSTNSFSFRTAGVSNRMVIDSSGNVGIGTTSPGAKLDVRGSGNFLGTAVSGAALVTIENNSGSTATSYGLLVKGGGNSSSGKTFEVRDDSGNTDLIVKGNGNVGIGTTSPSQKLHINNSATLTATYQKFTNGTATTGTTLGIDADGDFLINNGEAKEIKLYTNDTQRLTIQSGGNVGIGDTNPSFILDTNTTSSRARFKANTGNADIELSSIAGRDWLISSLTDGSLRFYDEDAASERMRITSDGNISLNGGILGLGKASSTPSIAYGMFHYSGIGLGIYSGAGGGTQGIGFWLNNGGAAYEAGRWLQNGNLGIGTTSPATKLHVEGAGQQWVSVYTTDITGAGALNGLRTQSSTDGRQNTLYRNTANNLVTLRAGTDDGEINFIAGGSANERMRILANGNVGIGMTSPNAPLDVLSESSNSSGIQQWSYNSAPGAYRLQLNQIVSSGLVKYSFDQLNNSVAYNNVLVLDRGNVGIGTDSPGAKLDVQGSQALFMTRTSSGLATYIENDGGYATQYMYQIGGGAKIVLHTNGNSYFNGGNVGIGVTSPIAQLDIGGNVSQHHSVSTSHNGGWRNIQNLGVAGWLDQTYSAGRLKVFGYENGSVNVSYCEYYVIRHNSGYALNQIGTRLDVGNTHGAVEVQISGNFLQVRNVAQSSLGVARVVFSGMKD